MFSLTRASLPSGILSKSSKTIRHVRCMATEAKTIPGKKEGDISSVFVSLSGAAQPQLPEWFANIKRNLIRGNESQLIVGWQKLLQQLQVENEVIAQQGPAVVPRIDFDDLSNPSAEFLSDVKKRGVAVINGVIPEEEARRYKTDVESYVKANPWTKGFPQNAPAVYELYWSPSQVRARAHSNMLSAQSFLLQLWHSKDKDALISTSNPLSYADRLRIRQPGDAGFALGPHVDGGGVERWEPDGYGRGGVYDKIWQGKWEEYDPWESSSRIPVISDLYEGPGACSMFRMFQGWLGMSHTAPKEGTLMVNPLLQLSTAYFLLRPFFTPIKEATGLTAGEYTQEFLQAENWKLKNMAEMTSELQGANPGHGQELNQVLHPHLDLQRTMVHVPKIKPGDYVVWHCDTIHAVDKVHQGKSDASVMYIPVCPTTEANAEYLVRQRECFLGGYPGPDFPGGKGESEHSGRPTASYIATHSENKGLQAMGLAPIELDGVEGAGAREAVSKANKLLGFA